MDENKVKVLGLNDMEAENLKLLLSMALERGNVPIANNVVEFVNAIDNAPMVSEEGLFKLIKKDGTSL
jgi:hypothetical protein